MDRSRPRGIITLLLAAALLVSLAAPLSAAPPARAAQGAVGAAAVRIAPDFADGLMAWLAGLWPGFRSAGGPTAWVQALGCTIDPSGQPCATSEADPPAGVQALGVDIDPSGQPGVQSLDLCSASSGSPTVTPQLGCIIDPNG